MTLDEYLRDTGLSVATFAAKCRPPIDRVTMWKIRKRLHNPSSEKVAAIEKASGYRVRAADLVKPRKHVANP